MTRIFIALFLLCSLSIAQAQDYATPVEYMSAIGEQSKSIAVDMMRYVSAAAHSKRARKIEKRRKGLIATTGKAIKTIRKMPDYNKDIAYRDAVANALELAYAVFNEDYAKIIDMEEIAEQSYDLMEALLLAKEMASEKVNNAMTALSESQRAFAFKNNIRLVESESDLDKMMAKAARVNKYHNQVFLILFKAQIEEIYLVNAMNENNLPGMPHYRDNLLTYAKEGQAALESVGGFDNDNSLITACGTMLKFYEDISNKDIQTLIDFYGTKADFEKTKERLENMRASDRTQADVDKYNGLVKKYNDMINEFNRVNGQMNQMKAQLFNAYSEAATAFLDRHTPKYK